MTGEDLKVLTGLEANYGGGIVGHNQPIMYRTKDLQGVARLAMCLVERWGLVACVLDGEDSAGRQKMRVMTPEELAKAACDTAEETWKQIEARGWTVDIPDPTPKRVRSRETEEA